MSKEIEERMNLKNKITNKSYKNKVEKRVEDLINDIEEITAIKDKLLKLSKLLKEAGYSRDITYRKIAHSIGIDWRTLYNWLEGTSKINTDNLLKAQFFIHVYDEYTERKNK